MADQLPIPGWDAKFLDSLVIEAKAVILDCARKSKVPLLVQFSGGRDSMMLLHLVRSVLPIDRFACSYMATGTELPGVVKFVKDYCDKEGLRLLVSQPGLHKGNLIRRVRDFKSFPNLGSFNGGGKRLWCCRDLKLRPQKKLLQKEFGKKVVFYKLEGVRRFESERRKVIYRQYAETLMRPDDEFKGSWEVFPILNFRDDDVLHYLELNGLPTMGQYREFGVSGCSWCPFYGPDIYARVIAAKPTWYDRFIELENELNIPSVHGGVFLRDIKKAVLEGGDLPVPDKSRHLAPPPEEQYEMLREI